MRFEFKAGAASNPRNSVDGSLLHESMVYTCTMTHPSYVSCGGCGSYGLKSNPNNTTLSPCLIMVDVNGDRKPTPGNANCISGDCSKTSNLYKVPAPNDKKLKDIFSIIITEDRAIPFGIVAQKAMYQAQK